MATVLELLQTIGWWIFLFVIGMTVYDFVRLISVVIQGKGIAPGGLSPERHRYNLWDRIFGTTPIALAEAGERAAADAETLADVESRIIATQESIENLNAQMDELEESGAPLTNEIRKQLEILVRDVEYLERMKKELKKGLRGR